MVRRQFEEEDFEITVAGDLISSIYRCLTGTDQIILFCIISCKNTG